MGHAKAAARRAIPIETSESPSEISVSQNSNLPAQEELKHEVERQRDRRKPYEGQEVARAVRGMSRWLL